MKDDPHVQLMLRFQEGDEDSFRKLFDIYKLPLLNFIYRFCQDRRVAEELSQEVFLRVYKTVSTYRPDAKFSTWIYRIAKNVCLNEIRAGRYRHEVDYSPGYGTDEDRPIDIADRNDNNRADQQIINQERRKAVQEAISRLPGKQRLALISSEYEHLSYKEIAQRLECSEGAVKSIIHRAKIALKDILVKDALL